LGLEDPTAFEELQKLEQFKKDAREKEDAAYREWLRTELEKEEQSKKNIVLPTIADTDNTNTEEDHTKQVNDDDDFRNHAEKAKARRAKRASSTTTWLGVPTAPTAPRLSFQENLHPNITDDRNKKKKKKKKRASRSASPVSRERSVSDSETMVPPPPLQEKDLNNNFSPPFPSTDHDSSINADPKPVSSPPTSISSDSPNVSPNEITHTPEKDVRKFGTPEGTPLDGIRLGTPRSPAEFVIVPEQINMEMEQTDDTLEGGATRESKKLKKENSRMKANQEIVNENSKVIKKSG